MSYKKHYLNTLTRLVLFVTAPFAFTACEHPIDFTTSHIDVADLVIRSDSNIITDTPRLAYTVRNDHWQGTIPLTAGQAQTLHITIIDFKGIELPLTRNDLEIRMETDQPTLLQWEPWTGYGILHPFSPGTTRVRFLVWHGSHPDFITPWLSLEIQEGPTITTD